MDRIDDDNLPDDTYLEHIGIARRSGRYPWGSGGNPYQRAHGMQQFVDEMLAAGMSKTEIAAYVEAQVKQTDPYGKFKSQDLRDALGIAADVIRTENIARAVSLKETGMSGKAIEREMGVNESTIRGWLNAFEARKESVLRSTVNMLKGHLADKEFLDVGKGNNLQIGVSDTRLRMALTALKDEGYQVHSGIKGPQLGTQHETKHLVLTNPDVTWGEAAAAVREGRLKIIASQSDDGGETFRTPASKPVSIPLKRVDVRFKEDGGGKMDGVIELRPGVADLDLGPSRYGQVRVAVNNTHYLKGMAMYATDLPDGVDIRYNSTKSKADGKLGAMKPMKVDKDGNVNLDNPFGSQTYPLMYKGANGKDKTSALNAVGGKDSANVEGRWDLWSRNLSSQMLSKQPVTLASTQLAKARAKKEQGLADILSMTNPVVKQKLLDEFADSADAAAVHLKAAKMPNQSTHVLLPMNSMRPTEVYAPNFDTGTRVVLVRHPHGGPFEIPALTVNNNNRTAKAILAGAKDAIGIHHTVADQLSGADFDGDTVLVIPNPLGKIKTRPPLEGLAGFDAKAQYKIPDDNTSTTRMTKHNLQTEMGKISNLITDMTIMGATDSEKARAIKHSMVVIDAEKHGLDYKQSAADNNITALKKTYQGVNSKGMPGGAKTIISRSSSELRIPEIRLQKMSEGGKIDPKTGKRVGGGPVDPKTGKLIWVPTGNERKKPIYDDDGNVIRIDTVKSMTKRERMALTDDARTLLSDPKNPQPIEQVYALHANSMKAMANEARKASYALTSQLPPKNRSAESLYAKEVASLNEKLAIAQRNAPLERRANAIGNGIAKTRIAANPMADKDEVRKIQAAALAEGREITGANKLRVYVEDREWKAIQAGALAPSRLKEILTNSDMDRVKTLATPRYRSSLTPGQLARAKQMAAQGRPMSEIADSLGIPRTTISDNLKNA